MKLKNLIIILTLSIIAATGCNSDKDILASYKDGSIQRKELRSFYKIYSLDSNPGQMTVEFQSSVINEIVLQNVVYKHFNDIPKPEYEAILDLTKKQFQTALYKKDYIEKMKKKSSIEMLELQLMVVKDAEKNKDKIANYLKELNQLKSSDKIAEFIAQNTDEVSRKSIGGLLEPFCINCGEDPLKSMFQETISKNDEKFHMTVSGPNAYLYKILKTKKVDLDDLDSYIKDKFADFTKTTTNYLKNHTDDKSKQDASYYSGDQFKDSFKSTAEHYRNKRLNFLWSEQMEKLKTNSGIVINESIMKETNLNDNSILYTEKSGNKFTLGELSKEYDKVASFNANLTKENQLRDKLGFFFQLYLPYKIISKAEDFNEISKSDVFINGIEMLQKSIVWKYKQKKLASQDVTVSEQEILDTYNAGKMYAYSTPDKLNPAKRNPMPYASIKDKIKSEVLQSKKTKILQDFMQKIQKDYTVVVNTKELKAGKI